MFKEALFKDFGTYREYVDEMIVVHVGFWTAFVDRCYKSNFKARRYDPCYDGKIDDVCAKGFAIMIATSLRKPGRSLSGPAAFLVSSA